ncbi:MAG: hypothetical protein SWC96_10815 [Thermodesulfobacteriota bacterium]|nr:hypothetical protein [Thermodesulfobacteriota bacterium]
MASSITLINNMSATHTGLLSSLSPDVGFESKESTIFQNNITPPWIVFVYPVGKERSTYQATEVVSSGLEPDFTPRTALGKTLATLRAKAIATGIQLLSENEVLEEVKRRRGELEADE